MITFFFSFGNCIDNNPENNVFWKGSPLFLNITVLFAIVLFIAAFVFFTIKHYLHKKKKREALQGKAAITNQNQYFDPKDDNDPNRPMAVIMIPIDGKVHVAGNVSLLEKLPHITPGVVAPLKDKPKIDLFAPQD